MVWIMMSFAWHCMACDGAIELLGTSELMHGNTGAAVVCVYLPFMTSTSLSGTSLNVINSSGLQSLCDDAKECVWCQY
jgi:hypothetical protein